MIETPRPVLMKTLNEFLLWFWIIDGWLLTKGLIICTLVMVISMELFIKDLAFIVFLQDGFQNSSQDNKRALFYIQPKRTGSPSPRTGGSLRRIVNGDDTWLHHYEPQNKGQNMEWKCQTLLVKRQFKTHLSVRKVMLTRCRDSRDQLWNTTYNSGKSALVTCSEAVETNFVDHKPRNVEDGWCSVAIRGMSAHCRPNCWHPPAIEFRRIEAPSL